MPLFVVHERTASQLTFRTVFEANDEIEASDRFQRGEAGLIDLPPEIGDTITDWPTSTEVLPFLNTESEEDQLICNTLAVEACNLLVAAYRRGLGDGASIRCEDLDEAAATAAQALGVDLNETEQDEQLRKLGYTVVETRSNHFAWRRDLDDGTYALIQDDDVGTEGEAHETIWKVSRHNTASGYVEVHEEMTFEDAHAIAEKLPLPVGREETIVRRHEIP